MVNISILWMLVVPIIMSALSFVLLPKYTKTSWRDSLYFSLGGLVISALIILMAVYAGKGIKTADVQILNGEITGKKREHGHYIHTYQCNCTQSCSGSGQNRSCTTTCQTCYEDRYTVGWYAYSNVGSFTIDYKDWGSKRVYALPSPPRWLEIKSGDPVSVSSSYTNYIKAVPETLFRPVSKDVKEMFGPKLPNYPGTIFDFYKINRVVTSGITLPNAEEWNAKLSDVLKKLGPQKQANAIVVLTDVADPNYFYALQDKWMNGKKNDVVLVIGAPDFPKKAAWVNIMALTDNSLFKIELRDAVLDLEELTADSVITALDTHIKSNFVRKSMKDFAYLDNEIDPPDWLIWTTLIAIISAYVGFGIYIRKNGWYN